MEATLTHKPERSRYRHRADNMADDHDQQQQEDEDEDAIEYVTKVVNGQIAEVPMVTSVSVPPSAPVGSPSLPASTLVPTVFVPLSPPSAAVAGACPYHFPPLHLHLHLLFIVPLLLPEILMR